MDPDGARRRGLTSTVTFPKGNLAPGGSVIKSTSIDPSVVGEDGVYRMTGPARVFRTEKSAIAAIKGGGIRAGDILVLMCRGPMGSGMEEIYRITAALRYLDFGKHVGSHHGRALQRRLDGRVHRARDAGSAGRRTARQGARGRPDRGDRSIACGWKAPSIWSWTGAWRQGRGSWSVGPSATISSRIPGLPRETRLWAALQDASGGTWGGCVFDDEAILGRLALPQR